MSIETMTKLATTTLSSTATTVTFSNIPQTYTDLVLKISSRTDSNSVYGSAFVRPNGATTNLSGRAMEAHATSSVTTYAETSWRFEPNGATATASSFGNAELYIKDYTGSNYKSAFADTVTGNNATEKDLFFKVWLWKSTEAITSLDIVVGNSQNYQTNSTFTLYGIKNARKATPTPPWARGGSVSFDGTNFIHTFTSSDIFIPNKDMEVDYLVVGGGGAGGGWGGGGGGAGGLRSTVTTTGGGGSLESKIKLTAGNPYTVGVGAGGTGVASGATTGAPTSGSESGFASIVSKGGGAGSGDTPVTAPLTGGSGGGGCNNATNRTGAAGTTNQGYAGGNGAAGANSYYASGGGGGAGAVGTNGVSSPSFNATGGNGVAVSITGSSVTYAGGGGGAIGMGESPAPATTTINGAAGGTGGGGAGGNAVHNNANSSTDGTSGTANRGGGGGGAPSYSGPGTAHKASGNGGSGIVIIRYKA